MQTPKKRIEDLEDLRKIVALKAVIESGSLRKAATLLQVTPSAVSQAIGSLERKLGRVMLIREKGGIRPSPDGLALLQRLDPAWTLLDQALATEPQNSPLIIKSMNLGIYESLAIGVLARFESRLRLDYPDIKLHLHASRSSQVIQRIRSGELCFGLVTETNGMDDLAMEKISEDRFGIFITEKSPLAAKPWTELSTKNIGLLSAPHDGWPTYFSRYLRSLGENWVAGLQTDSMEVLLSAAESGLMPVILPHRVAGRSRTPLKEISGLDPKLGHHGIFLVSTLKCDRRELKYLSKLFLEVALQPLS